MLSGGGLGKDGAYFKPGFKKKLKGILEDVLSGLLVVGLKEDTQRNLEDSSNQNILPFEILLCAGLSKQAACMATVLLSPHCHAVR